MVSLHGRCFLWVGGLGMQGALDSFGKYLYGVVLADRDRKDDVRPC